MKKAKIIACVSLCGLVLGLGTISSHAAEKAETSGTITFTDGGDGGGIHKPELPLSPIEPEGGGSAQLGKIYLKHVPDLDFGTVAYKVGADTALATFESYKDGHPGAGVSKGIPHFLQVYDGGGTASGGWVITVRASSFKSASNDVLPNAHIVLKEGKLSNDVYGVAGDSGATITDKVDTGISGAGLVIPRDAAASAKLIGAKSGQTTKGSNTSLVFSTAYDKNADYSKTKKNEGVQFVKTANDIPEANELYTSTITWEVTDGYMP